MPLTARAGKAAVFGLWRCSRGALRPHPLRRLVPEAHERIREMGIDLGKPPHAEYPNEIWVMAVDWAPHYAFPELAQERPGAGRQGRNPLPSFAATGTPSRRWGLADQFQPPPCSINLM